MSEPEATLWVDAHLATMVAGRAPYGAIGDGAVLVRDGVIDWVGRRADLDEQQKSGVRVESAAGAWMTPGLIDCHTHLVYAGNRAREFELRLHGAGYAEIARAGGGIVSTVAATREATEAELESSAGTRLVALMSEGVTTVEIKSGYGLDFDTELRMLRVARSLGARYAVDVRTTFLGAHALPPEYVGRAGEYIAFVCEHVLPEAKRQGLADAVDMFCETIGFSPAQCERVLRTAQSLGLPTKMHADQLSDLGGGSLAAHYGSLSADHLEWLSPQGVEAMAAAGTVAVLLPGAFYFLGETHLPPIAMLREHGVRMAVATDSNPGSSPACSLLLMLSMACRFFALTPEEALAGVTREAAAALGLASSRGTLERGKRADFVLWDIQEPAELAYRFGYNPCRQVVQAGHVVHRV